MMAGQVAIYGLGHHEADRKDSDQKQRDQK
jgi:hypothetical protein